MTATGTFDVDLAALFGTATDGAYVVKATQSARVGGIVNDGGNGSSEFNTRVTKTGTTPSRAPLINSAVANAVAKGYAFKQNLNGVDPDGGPVTYVSRAGQSNGPSYDVVSISAAGVVSMTAPQTDAFSNGQYFTYTVRVVDSTGDYSERDVLLTVTNTNIPPVIHGLSSTPIPFTAGVSQSVNFTADDADSGQTVSLALAAGAPAWVSLNATPGNPANATLTVNPPANLPAGTYAFNIDGVDSHSSVPLFASEPVEVVIGGAPAETTLTAKPNALTNSATATFAFASDFNAATFECKLDAGAWTACASPATFPNLADGQHTFQVRALNAAAQADATPESHTWTVDTAAPAAPALIGAPEGTITAKTAKFTWTGEDGAASECSIDGGAFAPCASPLTLNRRRHRQAHVPRASDRRGRQRRRQPRDHVDRRRRAEADRAHQGRGDHRHGRRRRRPGRHRLGRLPRQRRHALRLHRRRVRLRQGARGRRRASRPRPAPRKAKAKLVKIGRGHVKANAAAGAKRLAVDIELNATGRRLVAEQITGINVVLKIEARTVQGPKLNSRTNAKLVPQKQLIVPENGLFATGSAKLSKAGVKLVKSVGDRLGKVKAVTCVGHTDSVGSDAVNQELGLARAKAVCAALKQHGARGQLVVQSAGESAPRATNATAEGRALNRRVDINVRYR